MSRPKGCASGPKELFHPFSNEGNKRAVASPVSLVPLGKVKASISQMQQPSQVAGRHLAAAPNRIAGLLAGPTQSARRYVRQEVWLCDS